MSKAKPNTVRRGRDARTGQWIPLEEAKKRPATTVIERIPLPPKKKN